MDKKDPIPFQARKRHHTSRKPSNKGPVRPPGGGETDDVREYWQRFFRNPIGGPGRLLWTERMLWGNALLAALIVTVGTVLEDGFSFLLMIRMFINTFFLFFLVYYLFPWVTDWILKKQRVRSHSVDSMKLEVIVLSGWLVMANIIHLIPYFSPFPYYAALLGFFLLLFWAVSQHGRAPWPNMAAATTGGAASVALVMLVLGFF